MFAPLHIMLVSHGFPPHETAGTERHTAALAEALRERGHTVTVVAATRRPGENQYAQITEPGVIRIVNNISTRPLAEGESDPIIDRMLAELEAELRPDLVHVHHIQFLSSTMRFEAPTVVTLHDEWAWCPSGGLGLMGGRQQCLGPAPERCAPCHAAWRPQPSTTARRLTQTARLLSPLVRPDVLHQLYKRIPSTLRPSAVSRGGQPEHAFEAERRNRAVMDWFNAAAARIAPSDHLREKALANGLGGVELVRHGLSDGWFQSNPAASERVGFVSIGTVAWHKGTDRVVAAYRAVFPDEGEPLKIHGPILDADAALGHRVDQVLSPDGVRALLRQSKALIMGSRWSENAPLILLEARAAGCPVIAPAVGGIPELIKPGVDGLLCDSTDDNDLAAQWRKFLSMPPMSPRPPQRFSVTVDALEQIYRRTTREHACA